MMERTRGEEGGTRERGGRGGSGSGGGDTESTSLGEGGNESHRFCFYLGSDGVK